MFDYLMICTWVILLSYEVYSLYQPKIQEYLMRIERLGLEGTRLASLIINNYSQLLSQRRYSKIIPVNDHTSCVIIWDTDTHSRRVVFFDVSSGETHAKKLVDPPPNHPLNEMRPLNVPRGPFYVYLP